MAGWEIVGYREDPIPDDPAVVAAQIDHIRAVAADIATQVGRLPTDGAVDAIPWDSDAAPRFKQVVKKLPKDLNLLKVRYTKVADALTGFNQVLTNVRAQARDSFVRAQAAYDQIQAAQAGVQRMNDFHNQAQQAAARQNASAPPGSPPVTAEPWTGPDYQVQLASAQQAFNAAKSAIDSAVSRFQAACRTAAQAVGAASNDSLKNDTSLWGSITHIVGSVAHWISQHVPLAAISGILGKIAAVAGLLSFIPVVGEFFAVVALVAVGLSLICDLVLAANDAYMGTFGWHNVITLGIDAASLGMGFAAEGLRGGAQTAATAAEGATKAAQAADQAAKAATVARLDAEATVAANSARLASLAQRNIVVRAFLRVTGTTGRAENALASSVSKLTAASRAEAQSIAAARQASSAAIAAARTARVAKNASYVAMGAEKSLDGADLANTAHSESPAAQIWTAIVRSPGIEINHLINWSDDPAASTAQSMGAGIRAQPIPVASGH